MKAQVLFFIYLRLILNFTKRRKSAKKTSGWSTKNYPGKVVDTTAFPREDIHCYIYTVFIKLSDIETKAIFYGLHKMACF